MTSTTTPGFRTVDPRTLAPALERGEALRLIDVRTPGEFRAVHARGAHSMPLDRLDPQAVASLPGEGPIYVICRSGARSTRACEQLAHSDLDVPLVSIDGGTDAWEQAGLPVERGQGTISIERQVRIAAGALVLTGVALGFLVHPAGFGLSAFVGAGLMFAGITNTCAMGMALARMPWNR
jgi:rhodanese-related sulfurtransferase